MEWYEVLALMLGVLMILFVAGTPVAFAFILINIGGLYFFMGARRPCGLMVTSAFATLASFVLAPVLLFILMGEIMFRSGLAVRTLDALDQVDRRHTRAAEPAGGGRRHSVLHPQRLEHGHDRHAGNGAGTGDAAPGLQLSHVGGAHIGGRRSGRHRPALGHGRAAGQSCRDLHRQAPDRRHRPRSFHGGALRRVHRRPGQVAPRVGAPL